MAEYLFIKIALTAGVACFVLLVMNSASAEPADQPAAEKKPPHRRIVYHDDSQSLNEAPAEGTIAFLHDFLDREVDFAPITTFCYLVALPDPCLYDTKVGEVFGERMGFRDDIIYAPAIKALRDQNTDVLEVVVEHLKPKGIEVLAAVRMGDTHARVVDPDEPRTSQFTIDHPEYIIRHDDGRTNETALDYTHPEVRERTLAILRELVENYDIDGLELNFIRWGKHFPRHLGRERAPIMTEFMQQVAEMMDAKGRQRGKPLTLGVIVPESIDCCWLAGIDIETWIRKDWLDYVTVAPFNETDPQLPIGEFVELAEGTDTQILAQLGNMIGSSVCDRPIIKGRGTGQYGNHYTQMVLTAPEARGCAANYYAWGADGISYWNLSCVAGTGGKYAGKEQRERIRQWAHAVVDREGLYAHPRVYHYLPLYKGFQHRKPPVRNYAWAGDGVSPLGAKKAQVLTFPPGQVGQRQTFNFLMADGRDGQPLEGTLEFWVYHLDVASAEQLTVDINGTPVDPAAITAVKAGLRRDGLPGVRFEIPLAKCPPFKGQNQLGLTANEAIGLDGKSPYMEELIVTVTTVDDRP